jgi:hypothetical protein
VQVPWKGREGRGDPGADAGEALPPVLRHPLAVDEPLLEAAEGDVDGEVADLRRVVHRGGRAAGGSPPEPIRGAARVMDSVGLGGAGLAVRVVVAVRGCLLGLSTCWAGSAHRTGPKPPSIPARVRDTRMGEAGPTRQRARTPGEESRHAPP